MRMRGLRAQVMSISCVVIGSDAGRDASNVKAVLCSTRDMTLMKNTRHKFLKFPPPPHLPHKIYQTRHFPP